MINKPSRQELDNLIRKVFVDPRVAFDNVADTKAFLDQLSDAELTQPGGGYEYTPAEVASLRSALNDQAHLRAVAMGQATQATPVDFFAHPRTVWGINPTKR